MDETPHDPLPKWFRPARAADYTGVAASTLAKRRLDGTGPPFSKVGRSVVYSKDDLDLWLAARRRRSTSDDGGEA